MAKIEIVALGHALVAGARGEKGGKPSKDSVWGVALVQGNMVTFGGRRGAETLRFNTFKKAEQEAVMAKFAGKLIKAQGGFNYTDVTANFQEVVGADFAEKLGKMYYKAMANKKLNIRRKVEVKTTKVEAKAEVVSE